MKIIHHVTPNGIPCLLVGHVLLSANGFRAVGKLLSKYPAMVNRDKITRHLEREVISDPTACPDLDQRHTMNFDHTYAAKSIVDELVRAGCMRRRRFRIVHSELEIWVAAHVLQLEDS